VRSAAFAALLAWRGEFDEALSIVPFVPRSATAGPTLWVMCEIAAARARWDDAPELVAWAREEAAHGEQLWLPLSADRLEGRAAAAAGDPAGAAQLLARAAEGFATLEARWEEAWSRLLLAEVVLPTDRPRAESELAAALPVFERLSSVRELERARALLQSAASPS
jgi:hypothetical protein